MENRDNAGVKTDLQVSGGQAPSDRRARLYIMYDGNAFDFDLMERPGQRLGRPSQGNMPDLPVNSPIISRRHGVFDFTDGVLTYRDEGSSNGTTINDRAVEKGVPVRLQDGSVLRIHAVNSTGSAHDVVIAVSMSDLLQVEWKKIPLGQDVLSLDIGRNQEIALRGRTVSRKHATFFHAQNGWAIIDNRSRNGVFLNGRRIGEPVLLQPMDLIFIAHHIFLFEGESLLYQADRELSNLPSAGAEYSPSAAGNAAMPGLAASPLSGMPGLAASPLSGMPGLALSPAPDAHVRPTDIVRPGGPASAGQYSPEKGMPPKSIAEMGIPPKGIHQKGIPQKDISSKGSPETGRPGEKGPAAPPRATGSAARRGRTPVRGAAHSGRMLTIHIEERTAWAHLQKKVLLRDIHLQVESGSMVLILGGSGAGKTTFMNAVMGYEPAKGRITYGNADIYREYEKMKYEIGYVPQQDLLRMEDAVYETLDNAAQMRLPDSIGPEERNRRVGGALDMFGLFSEKDALVGKISGGQRKRLSIAVEYIGNPSLFFLDEPDSGLDGIMARELMENLRQIADQGKIVMVISHSPDRAFDLFDKVIVLAKSDADKSGHLVYYGAPQDSLQFFDTNSLEGIVGRVNRKDEGGQGLADYYMNKYRSTGGR